MIGFVETPRRRPEEPESFGSPPPLWTLIFMGILLILTVTVSFIPLSQISGMDVAILFMVLVVLPLLFLSVYLTTKFGYGILFAAFLSVPAAITSTVILGDFFSLVYGKNIVEGISVRDATLYPSAKIFIFRDPILLHHKTFDSIPGLSPSSSRDGTDSSHNQVKELIHSLVPIVDSDQKEGEEISAFAVCSHTSLEREDCSFLKTGITGGFQVPGQLRTFLHSILRQRSEDLGIVSKTSPVFLYWVPRPKERIYSAGIYGLGFIAFLNGFWAVSIFLYYNLKKKS